MPAESVRQAVEGLAKGRPSRTVSDVFDEAHAVRVRPREEASLQTIQLYDVVQIAHHFGVSRQAAIYRLANVDIIGQRRMGELLDEDAEHGKALATGMGLTKPKPPSNEFKHRFLGYALEAIRRGLISKGKFAELASKVDLDAASADALLDDAGLSANAEEVLENTASA